MRPPQWLSEYRRQVPRYLVLRLVVAQSHAHIHGQNLATFGMLMLHLQNPGDYNQFPQGDRLRVENIHDNLQAGAKLAVQNVIREESCPCRHEFSDRQVARALQGGQINRIPENCRTDSKPAQKARMM